MRIQTTHRVKKPDGAVALPICEITGEARIRSLACTSACATDASDTQ